MSSAETLMSAPVAVVYAALLDHADCPAWFTMHAGFPDGPPGRLEAGMRFRQKLTLLGSIDTWTFVVSAADEDALVALAGKGGFGGRAEISYALRADGDRTRIAIEMKAAGMLPGPLRRKVADIGVAEIEHSLCRLDAVLSGSDPEAVARPPLPMGAGSVMRVLGKVTGAS